MSTLNLARTIMAVLTYKDAALLLGNKPKRKLGNNTYLVRHAEDALGVKLHETIVVYIFKSGVYQYDSGGWQTVTTKYRINEYGPVKIHQKNNIWYIGDYIFADGVRVRKNGTILNKKLLRLPKEVEDKKRKLDKLVRNYIKGFGEHIQKNGLQTVVNDQPTEQNPWKVVDLNDKPQPLAPGPGDCWACYFGLTSKDALKEPLGVEHLLQHMLEDYYVPSLLWKAILTAGYTNPPFIWQHIDQFARRGDVKMVSQILNGYFRKRKSAMLELV